MGFNLIENCGCGNEFACSAKILRWFLLRALKLNSNRRIVELTEQFSALSFSSCSSPKQVIFVLPKLKLKWLNINRLYIQCNRIWNINSEYVENFTFSYDPNACSMFTRIIDSDETEINCCSRSWNVETELNWTELYWYACITAICVNMKRYTQTDVVQSVIWLVFRQLPELSIHQVCLLLYKFRTDLYGIFILLKQT